MSAADQHLDEASRFTRLSPIDCAGTRQSSIGRARSSTSGSRAAAEPVRCGLRWREILERPPDDVAAFLTERSEEAAWLRKASPFAGVLPPRQPWRILREVE